MLLYEQKVKVWIGLLLECFGYDMRRVVVFTKRVTGFHIDSLLASWETASSLISDF